MKKTSALILTLTLVLGMTVGMFSLAAAANKADQRYVFVTMITGHPFWTEIKQGMQDAANQLGVKFEFSGPVEWDAAAQASQVEQLIITKPAGFIIGQYDPSMTPVINKAVEAGIPVVTIDSDAPGSKRSTFIGPDHYKMGWSYGEWMAKALGGKGKIGLLTAVAQTNLNERIRGIKEYFAKNAPEMEVIAIEDNMGDDQISADKTKAIIQGHPEVGGIICVNGTGSGIAVAIKEMGKVGKIKVLTSDVSDPLLKGILDGAIDTTAFQNIYLEGYYSVKILYDIVNGNLNGVPGKDVGVNLTPPTIEPGVFFITKENAASFLKNK